jgi:hypothetical protein
MFKHAFWLVIFFSSLACDGLLSHQGRLAHVFQDLLLYAPVPGKFSRCERLTQDGFEPVDTEFKSVHVRAYLKREVQAKAWLIIFHGNAESACTALSYAKQFAGLALNYAIDEKKRADMGNRSAIYCRKVMSVHFS